VLRLMSVSFRVTDSTSNWRRIRGARQKLID
jgi:hypothetical protein